MNRMIRSGASVESISCFGHLARWYAVALRAFLTEIDFVLLKRPPTYRRRFFLYFLLLLLVDKLVVSPR